MAYTKTPLKKLSKKLLTISSNLIGLIALVLLFTGFALVITQPFQSVKINANCILTFYIIGAVLAALYVVSQDWTDRQNS